MTKYWIGQDPNAEATTAKCAALAALSSDETELLDGAGTGGTGVASKALVADSNQNIGVIKGTALHIGTSGSEVELSADEIVRVCDVSTRVVTLAASTTIAVATHENKILLLGKSGAAYTMTLPAASGSGAIYRFIVSVVNTSNYVITVTGNDTIDGSVDILDLAGTAQASYAATGTVNTITLNGTDQGGAIGDWLEFRDIAADQWAISGGLTVPAASTPVADPFSTV